MRRFSRMVIFLPIVLLLASTAQATAEQKKPDSKLTVYLLPHSHVDIGYTKVQTQVERDHWRFFEMAIEAAGKTAGDPPESRFKWNVEVLWALDSYLKQATPQKRRQFVAAVKNGSIGLDALYGSELTGLCRPEELVQLTACARRISRQYGLSIDSAMITDVPGATWGLASVLADSGVRYLSMGPNVHARFGRTFEAWADKPFYWETPCGRHKILCWVHGRGYWRVFRDTAGLMTVIDQMRKKNYPYDIVALRYCLGDNSGPGLALCEMVRKWNAANASPRLVIATTSEAFKAFERRHGKKLPTVRGDFTPYWEDGAGSSARETSLNRTAAERLVQAATLWAMLRPTKYPSEDFRAAWQNAILYDEHTWGASRSVSQPDGPQTKEQWAIKQAFALDADKQSRALLGAALGPRAAKPGKTAAVQVFNTCSWPRTDLVALPKDASGPGDSVKGPDGKRVPSQRLSDGRLAFVASDVPPFGAKKFTITSQGPLAAGNAKASQNTLQNAELVLTIDRKTGAVSGLRAKGIQANLVNTGAGLGLNDYFYVAGNNNKDAKRSGPVKIAVKERGPLVASLLVEGDAPGCRKLSREVRIIEGLGRVDIIDILDKKKIRTKEGVHIAFAFNVPKGVMRMDIPWAVARVEADQLPGANKNYFSVGRWVDVSNSRFGVTWATVDAPLVEVGAITAPTSGKLANVSNWIKTIQPSQTLYSYVMNNYWWTNYRADQEGPTTFRYAVQPHSGDYDAVAAARFGIEQSQPLIAAPAAESAPAVIASRLTVKPDDVIVTAFKPSDDGKAWIIRLFGVAGRDAKATLRFADPAAKSIWMSNLGEDQGSKVSGPVQVPGFAIVTLRADLPE